MSARKRILVTGASGFIGGHACAALVRAGASVRAMVRKTSDVRHLEQNQIEICHGDLADEQSLRNACKNIDIVLHSAAVVGSFGEWEHYYETGVLGTQRLINAAHEQGVGRFVHLSSVAVYGIKHHGQAIDENAPFDHAPQSWNHYVREKVMGEEVLWAAHAAGKIQATALRPVVVIGERDRNAIPRLVDILRLPIRILPGKPDNRFPLVCIEDCVEVIVRAIENEGAIGRAYNISGTKAIPIVDIFRLVAKHAGLAPPKLFLPTSLMFGPVGLLERVWKLLGKAGEPIVTRIVIGASGYDYEFDSTRAQRELGWQPRDEYESAVMAALAR